VEYGRSSRPLLVYSPAGEESLGPARLLALREVNTKT
jgi:hypothetical protein